jgi:hypothetical protein
MTVDGMPNLARLDLGDPVTVYYRSERSGNEVRRKGEVTDFTPADDGRMVWVHNGQRAPLKHQYVTMMGVKPEDGDPAVLAQSATVSADPPNDGDPPAPGRSFRVTFTIERSSFLGVVDRIMRDGVNINLDHPGDPFGVDS